MNEFTELDNPVWFALNTMQKEMSLSFRNAARYQKDIATFAALKSPEDFRDLYSIVDKEETVALVTSYLQDFHQSERHINSFQIDQMICNSPALLSSERDSGIVKLGLGDVGQMTALVALTEPGPFYEKTILMGNYYGIKTEKGELAAMAGERMKMNGFTEISAVCTHPDFRGRGYAKMLVSLLSGEIFKAGKIPFLHVRKDNPAIKLYKKIGFNIRSAMNISIVSPVRHS